VSTESSPLPNSATRPANLAIFIGVTSVLLAALLWAYWPNFTGMAETWSHDPQYSHGFIVPLYALILLWLRRDLLPQTPRESWGGQPQIEGLLVLSPRVRKILFWTCCTGCALVIAGAGAYFAAGRLHRPWLKTLSLPLGLVGAEVVVCTVLGPLFGYAEFAGLFLILHGLALRVATVFLHQEWLAGVSLLPCLAGVTLLAGGRRALRWALPSILFLLFMIPLPYSVHHFCSNQLQTVATNGSVYALETSGISAYSFKHIITLPGGQLGIEEACSGLAMLVTFFALATALAIVLRRPLLDRIVLVISAVPVAILVNILRITLTGVLHEKVGRETAMKVFHDWAAWFMIPIALGMFFLVLLALSRLFRETAEPRPKRSKRLRPA